MKVYDYLCPECGQLKENELVEHRHITVECACGALMVRQNAAPTTFSTIVPAYPGSKKHKAGHVHKFGNRPAEKTQVGYGGGVSKDHPTGSTKNKD